MKQESIAAGVAVVALTTLLLELTLIRVFDTLWYPNLAFMVITMAMFAFGLAGVYLSLFPVDNSPSILRRAMWLCIAMAFAILAIIPAVNSVEFDYRELGSDPAKAIFAFLVVFAVLTVPFFLGGFVLSAAFSKYSEQIQRLYFWDLTGAGFGSVLILILIAEYGAGGLVIACAGAALLAAGWFTRSWARGLLWVLGLATIAYPTLQESYIEFNPHVNKRGFSYWQARDRQEYTKWDQVSRIDVFGVKQRLKWIAYDGGTQTSNFYQFDGDFNALKSDLPENSRRHFYSRVMLLSHYLKRNSGQRVLVIGAAGGQETKAALTYGATHVDAIELVGTVIDLGKNDYAEFTGNVYNDPRVNARRGEGRSFLRSTNNMYDIIQMWSNHTSSSIAAGGGAMAPSYLQTVDAYIEYFSHLKPDGILQINHHAYPRMVATASRAWQELGQRDFQRHVMVFERTGGGDNLPALLIKMTPWSSEEVIHAERYLSVGSKFNFVVNPFQPERSFLSPEFFSGEIPKEMQDRIQYRIDPPTDDRPFFNFLRKSLDVIDVDPANFVSSSVAELVNKRREAGIPMDVLHLVVVGVAAVIFSAIFLFVPLLFSKAGRQRGNSKPNIIGYFTCLGVGFITFELCFVQIFMKLIGYPTYTYTTVIATFLLGAGIGSAYSEKLGDRSDLIRNLPFIGIAIYAPVIAFFGPSIFETALQAPDVIRIVVAIAMIFPLAFFLGMPFPLGILSIRHKSSGMIAWAWAFNGLFTVIGGLLSVVFAIAFGFKMTVLIATLTYIVAGVLYLRLSAASAYGT